MATASDSVDVLEKLMNETTQAVGKLEARASAGMNIEEHFADIQKKFEDAAAIKDQNERNVRMKVLEADLEELRHDATKEEQDLAQAVFGLNALLESMGQDYAELGEFAPAEKEIIQKAEAELAAVQEERRNAEHRLFFRQSAINAADQKVKDFTQRLENAKLEAKRLARQRLLQANIEGSLQEFMVRVDKTIQIMQRRMKEIEAQLQVVSLRKGKAFEVKAQAAQALEKLDQELNKKEADLKREEDLIQTFVNGSPEYAIQTKKISDLRADVERVRGSRNTAFVLYQSKEKFAAELEIHERTQMKLRDNQRMWIASLKSDTEERVVTFKSRLEAMKAASDQNVARALDDLGAEADQRNAEYMAAVGAASDRLRMEKIEKHPQRVAAIAAVAAAQAEAVQQIRVREAAAIEHFKKLYGIDPTASSFFHYQESEEKTEDNKPDSLF